MSAKNMAYLNKRIRLPVIPTLVLTFVALILSFMGMAPLWTVWLCLGTNSLLSAFSDHYWHDTVKKRLTEDEYNRFYPGGIKRRLRFRLIFGGLAFGMALFDLLV
jgi:hypothetical protein